MSTQEDLKVAEGLVLTVSNRHYESCGTPPNLQAGRVYTAYFENDYGEQLVFQYDRKAHKGTLWHGDCSWETPYDLLAGVPVGITLSEEEVAWLRLVWQVATRREPERVKLLGALRLARAEIAQYEKYLADPRLDDAQLHGRFKKEIVRWKREQAAVEQRLAEVLKESGTDERG